MRDSIRIHVSLLNEGIQVWRPVIAERIAGDRYQIVPQPYDRDLETWQFEPGDEAICELVTASEGPILAAVKKIGGI